jgi:hypothetical protein
VHQTHPLPNKSWFHGSASMTTCNPAMASQQRKLPVDLATPHHNSVPALHLTGLRYCLLRVCARDTPQNIKARYTHYSTRPMSMCKHGPHTPGSTCASTKGHDKSGPCPLAQAARTPFRFAACSTAAGVCYLRGCSSAQTISMVQLLTCSPRPFHHPTTAPAMTPPGGFRVCAAPRKQCAGVTDAQK